MNLTNLLAGIFLYAFFCCCKSEECLNADEDGTCFEPCPDDTVTYNSSCENLTMSQRTCREPEAKSLGYICDYFRCDCPEPKFWDEAAMKCVEWHDCSDQSRVEDDDDE